MKVLQQLALLWITVAAACTGVYSEPFTPTPGPGPGSNPGPVDGKRVFTTSRLYQGGFLGGIAGADAICSQHAAEAGLTGKYKAWLSAFDNSAAARLTHSTRPYVLVDGTRIADDWADLIHADIDHPINLDERGQPVTPTTGIIAQTGVWTGTLFTGEAYHWSPGGTPTDNPRLDCTLWDELQGIGMLGFWDETNASWTGSSLGIECTEKARVYCFEQ